MTPPALETAAHFFAIAAATFVSEDATCIASGLLIRSGGLAWQIGLGACLLGIVAGDLGLWLLGRVFGRRVLEWGWVRRRLSAEKLEQIAAWFDRRGWQAVVAARFVPGTRLPVYLAAGVLGRRAGRFALWALLAAVLWTPLLVLGVALLGEALVSPLQMLLKNGWLVLIASFVALFVALRVVPRLVTAAGRAQVWAGVSRVWRWEFWPAWLFYAPLAPWVACLAVRHRGLMTPTAANPGIRPHGGVVGESKYDILRMLPAEWVVPTVRIAPAAVAQRVSALAQAAAQPGWAYPIILKPDAGQRGVGLRLLRDPGGAAAYFESHPQPVIAQTYHPGPGEAGVFYVRPPGAARGRIFSITDKCFPVLTGDGESTVETLIWRHPRYRMQAATFLARLNGQARHVLPAGQRLPLAIAGNHCQGTLFRDGARLWTAALEHAIDAVARHFDGFHFGRFDIRYGDEQAFMAGRDFRIVELNGVTSESTNLYDPSWSLLRAYGVLFRQWATLYRIGAENRRRGHRVSSLRQVLADARAYYRERRVKLLAD